MENKRYIYMKFGTSMELLFKELFKELLFLTTKTRCIIIYYPGSSMSELLPWFFFFLKVIILLTNWSRGSLSHFFFATRKGGNCTFQMLSLEAQSDKK